MATGRKPPVDDEAAAAEAFFRDIFGSAAAADPDGPPRPEDIGSEPSEWSTVETIERHPALDLGAEQADEVPVAFAPLLPEMDAEIWQAGIQALVSVPDEVPAPPLLPDEWMAEARLYDAESTLAETFEHSAGLLFAAGRAAEVAGQAPKAARIYDEGLNRNPSAPDLLRARARLAESMGELDEAQAFWARLSLAAESTEERAYYAALSAEWTLARRGALPPGMWEAIPPGAARALASVEEALRGSPAASATRVLADAGATVGGPLGAALLDQAARAAEAAGDLPSATALAGRARPAASGRESDQESGQSVFQRLRVAARSGARTAAPVLDEALELLPQSSRLAGAVGRWAAALVRQGGNPDRAGAMLVEIGPLTAAAARDRIDLDLARGQALDGPSLARLRAVSPGAVALATLAWTEAADLVRRGEFGAALELLALALETRPDAVCLGLLAQEVAEGTEDAAIRAGALDLWVRADAARRATAALSLATVLEAGGPVNALAARSALQIAVEAAPRSALFWRAAAADAQAGRLDDAATVLFAGAADWGEGPIATALEALAAAKHALGDPARALNELRASRTGESGHDDRAHARALGVEATARLAERAGDWRTLVQILVEATALETDPQRRAWLAVRQACAFDPADRETRAHALAEALAAVPDHPLALPLFVLAAGTDAIADALAAAGGAPAAEDSLAALFALGSVSARVLAGDLEGAFHAASRLGERASTALPARRAAVRAAVQLAAEPGAALLGSLVIDQAFVAAAPAWAVAIADARIDAGAGGRAIEVLDLLPAGQMTADAGRTRARAAALADRSSALALPAARSSGLPAGFAFGPADDRAASAEVATAAIVDLARAGQTTELIAALEAAPPHEGVAGPIALAFGALLAEGHGLLPLSARLAAAAVRAIGADPRTTAELGVSDLARAAEIAEEPALRARAFELAAAKFGAAESDRRAAAICHACLARLDATSADRSSAVGSWRRALLADPTCLPAAIALRREAAGRGDAPSAAAACEAEAACLLVSEHRVRALLLAAALALEGAAPDRDRALAMLRAALAVDPAQEAAFERLRALLQEKDDPAALAAALATRIEVAQNPFEITSLRLARADLLAKALGDRAGARAELELVLRKQPEHVRALARLAELHWEGQAWAEAGEIYLKRAVIERAPATLREVFSRLGQIYSEHVPDAKRAVAAYERLLSIDPESLEALRALSDLYVAEGATKQALPVTERLLARETDAARRVELRVRLGEILIEAGDLRRAGGELRAAVAEAPRDLAAVSALAHYLERTHDQAGRRATLDRAVGLLRHDVERSPAEGLQLGTLRVLARLLTLRERPHAALALGQLIAALDPGGDPAARVATQRPGRRLAALRQAALDERAFPPDLPNGIRQLLGMLGPALRPGGQELVQSLSRHGVGRNERKSRGVPPRPVFDAVAAELGAGEIDVYVKAPVAASGPVPLRVEPGNPPAVILGEPILALGPAALRFAAGRTVRLAATHLDTLLAVPMEEAGALLVGIIRQFVPEFRHGQVRETLAAAETARLERLVPRRLKPQLMPFAVESAGAFDLPALYAAVRDGANAAGLLACADLPAALSVVLSLSGAARAAAPAVEGEPSLGGELSLRSIAANPEALALLLFAASDEHDDLGRALEA